MQRRVADYFAALGALATTSDVTDRSGRARSLGEFYDDVCVRARAAHEAGGRLMFVGNGGSAAIASHMAIDFAKNGRMRTMCFNDGAALTCLGNDLGYDQVFAQPIAQHATASDIVMAISSSGASANILNGVAAARAAGAFVVTMSGFRSDNPLRSLGDWNLYVPSGEYGLVEVTHLGLCHALLDLAMGWGAQAEGGGADTNG